MISILITAHSFCLVLQPECFSVFFWNCHSLQFRLVLTRGHLRLLWSLLQLRRVLHLANSSPYYQLCFLWSYHVHFCFDGIYSLQRKEKPFTRSTVRNICPRNVRRILSQKINVQFRIGSRVRQSSTIAAACIPGSICSYSSVASDSPTSCSSDHRTCSFSIKIL